MSLLFKRSRPAERERGLIFYETFDNENEFYKNGGISIASDVVIADGVMDSTAGVNSWVDYNHKIGLNAFTFIFEGINFINSPSNNALAGDMDTPFQVFWGAAGDLYVTSDGAVSATLALGVPEDNQNYFLAVTVDGSNINAYLDGGSALSAAFTQADFTFSRIFAKNAGSSPTEGTLSSLRVFDRALTEEEINNYYNDTVFNYDNEKVLDLPMDFNNYDSTNSKILDISGNGNDGTIVGTPDKLASLKGFDLNDTGTDYFTTTATVTTAGNTLSVLFSDPNINTGNKYLIGAFDGERSYISTLISGSDAILTGGVANRSRSVIQGSTVLNAGHYYHAVLTWNTTNYYLYLDGVLEATGTHDNDMPAVGHWIGGLNGSGATANGKIYDVKIYNSYLTPMQVKDLYLNLRQEYKNILE